MFTILSSPSQILISHKFLSSKILFFNNCGVQSICIDLCKYRSNYNQGVFKEHLIIEV
uniref:Uncharacterized protein n=1 Tax=Physcomitrium patens TaxID=3218 RepID=A0A2K1JS73_PHYPA|nr:hypothetical protein PHYPA_016765 [Physcomitrium patens]